MDLGHLYSFHLFTLSWRSLHSKIFKMDIFQLSLTNTKALMANSLSCSWNWNNIDAALKKLFSLNTSIYLINFHSVSSTRFSVCYCFVKYTAFQESLVNFCFSWLTMVLRNAVNAIGLKIIWRMKCDSAKSFTTIIALSSCQYDIECCSWGTRISFNRIQRSPSYIDFGSFPATSISSSSSSPSSSSSSFDANVATVGSPSRLLPSDGLVFESQLTSKSHKGRGYGMAMVLITVFLLL